MNTLLELQALDLKIEACKAREKEIPKQKSKFDVHRKRLAAELEERGESVKRLQLEQRECETDVEQKQTQITKYDQQLAAIKRNEEYQALLREIDVLKKQVSLHEERIIAIMMELDQAKERFAEDKKRIEAEQQEIVKACAAIDDELSEAVKRRKELEQSRGPLMERVDKALLARYERIRSRRKGGPVVVPLNGQACSGCFMQVTPQICNEVLAGEKIHACSHCGRLLYHEENVAAQ